MAEGVEVGRAYVTVLPNATGFATSLQSSIVPGATMAGAAGGKAVGGGLLGGIKAVAGPIAAIFAVDKIVGFFGDAIAGAEESSKVMRTTEQIIKSTGGTAKITAEQVGDLAGALSNKSGVDDEVIQKGANMLLTFKNVRNEAGKGADIFNRATAAAVDLSAAGFGSVESSSKMLGKALNDPVKGLTALGRAGVTFSEEQKTQIKQWVEQGDTLKAQKAIMAEVESQVGGVAAASANMSDKVAVAWGNFQEQVGAKLLPILDKVGAFFIDQLLPAFTTGLDVITGFAGGVTDAGGSFSGLLGPAQGFATWLNGSLLPVLTSLGATLQSSFASFQQVFGEVVAGLTTRLAPVMPVVQSIFGTIGSIITTVLGLVQTYITNFTNQVMLVWNTWGTQIMDVVSAVWSAVIGIVDPALKVVQNIIALVMNLIKGDWSAAWDNVKGIVTGVWDTIKATVTGAIGIVKSVLSLAWAVIRDTVTSTWNSIVTKIAGAVASFTGAVSDGVGKVVTWFKELPGKIISAIGNVASKLMSVGHDMVEGIWQGISNGYGWIKNKITGWVGDVVGFFKKVFGINSPSKRMADEVGRFIAPGAINPLYDALPEARRAAEALADALTPSLAGDDLLPAGIGAGVSAAYRGAAAGVGTGAAAGSVSYGDVKVELSMAELEQFRTLAEFLRDIDRKIQQGVA